MVTITKSFARVLFSSFLMIPSGLRAAPATEHLQSEGPVYEEVRNAVFGHLHFAIGGIN